MSDEVSLHQEVLKVVQASQLAAIHLRSCESICHAYPTSIEPQNTRLEVTTGAAWSTTDQNDVLICNIDIGVIGFANKPIQTIKEGTPLFEVKATVVAVYQMSEKDLSREALDVFASQNALFNTYPFLRETISNLTGKMGILPVLLPLLKPGTRAPFNKELETKKADAARP